MGGDLNTKPDLTFAWPAEPPLILVGPTAVGKTAAAIALAEIINAEIINADSMQVYRGMDIGTAKPSKEEQNRIPFHLLDITTPDRQFTVAEWKVKAEAALTEITRRKKRTIICGGTGLYIRALLDNWLLAETPADEYIRTRLQTEVHQFGISKLHDRLRDIDPVTAARLHPNDAIRIVRALEVFEITGQPISVYQQRDQQTQPARRAYRLGLTLPRTQLYDRINIRVETMIKGGWEDEVRCLLARGYSPDLGPFKSLGYKEMIQYVTGNLAHQTAIEEIQQNTRRFAKRQLTWFRQDRSIQWFDVSGLSSAKVAEHLHSALTLEKDGS